MHLNENLKSLIENEVLSGTNYGEIYAIAKARGYSGTYRSFKDYAGRIKRKFGVSSPKSQIKKVDFSDVLLSLLKERGSVKLVDVCDMFRCPPSEVKNIINEQRKEGHEILCDEHRIYLSSNVVTKEQVKKLGSTEITFGVASDLHFGSKSCQISSLHQFAEFCKRKGVKHMLCPGDIFAGHNVYPGQVYDLYAVSAEEQLNSAICNLPRGFEWYIMGGNHDYSFMSKGGGYNILNVLASKRKDIHYVGFDDVDVPILNGVDLKMIHPSGGIPYSISYRLQKNVEQISYSELTKMAYGSKEKPSIRFILSGHLHIQMQAMFGSIFGCQAGCFEGQTNYLKRKGLFPNIGGYVIQASLGRNGLLNNFEAKFYVFDEIVDDWQNYNHLIEEEKMSKPIFE